MLRRDRAEWKALVASLNARSAGALHGPESPRWEARDVYAHLARWINNSMDAFAAWLDGRRVIAPPEGSDDEINARWQAEDSVLPLDEARERAQRAFDRRLAAIEVVPPDGWDSILEEMARADGHKHYAAHRNYLESSLTKDAHNSSARGID
jgi:hypothetical protein